MPDAAPPYDCFALALARIQAVTAECAAAGIGAGSPAWQEAVAQSFTADPIHAFSPAERALLAMPTPARPN
jgi:hypothetical protein